MTKRLVYPPDVWGLYAHSWESALRADNKSDNTLYRYIQAVRLLGEWAHRQSPMVAPADVKPMHIRAYIVELVAARRQTTVHARYAFRAAFAAGIIVSLAANIATVLSMAWAPILVVGCRR
jgi:hypothetical protein